jgi:hypothetical protein
MKKISLLIVAVLFSLLGYSQLLQGDELIKLVGSSVNNAEVFKLLEDNGVKKATATKLCSNTTGIDCKLHSDTIVEVQLYRSNPVYGKFEKMLPKSIVFGMSLADIKGILGKPTVTYTNSGYSEYKIGKVTLTCWFEGNELNQVSISTP